MGLVSAWASRLGGGVFEAVVAHAALVRACGYEPVVVALEDAHSAADRARFGDTEVVTCAVSGPAMIGYAPDLGGALRGARLDLLHLHGIWMYPSLAASDWAAATGRPYVISPHGMLDPWITGRGKLKKAVARAAYEHRSWKRATLFHALTGREADDIARESGRRASVVIPNAIPAAANHSRTARPAALYLGRIHPKKNIDALIDGWDLAADALRPHGAELTIAGWGDPADVAALEGRLAARGETDIRFVGPVYGEAKRALLSGARFVTLPSHSEGLPMVILEGWAAGTPAILSEHCNLPEGFAAGAAIDCGTTPDKIAAALRSGFALTSPAWEAMSAAATALAASRFSPDAVAASWREIYSALLSGAPAGHRA
jgi:glycosyltransferase involved in cell wall biosynthesis